MTLTLLPTSQGVKISFNPVEYALFTAGLEQSPGLFERLVSSHLQQQQVAQQDESRAQVKEYLDTADPAQLAALMNSMNGRTKG